MIKTEKGHIELEGDLHEILADISVIAGNLKKIGFEKEWVEYAVNIGFKTDKELSEMARRAKKSMKELDRMEKFLKIMFGDENE